MKPISSAERPKIALISNLAYGRFRGEFDGCCTSGHRIETALGRDADFALITSRTSESRHRILDLAFTRFKNVKRREPISGIWTNVSGEAIESMVLVLTCCGFFSVFEYDFVGAGETGFFSSDPGLTSVEMSTNRFGEPYAILRADAFAPLSGALPLFASALVALRGFAHARRP